MPCNLGGKQWGIQACQGIVLENLEKTSIVSRAATSLFVRHVRMIWNTVGWNVRASVVQFHSSPVLPLCLSEK